MTIWRWRSAHDGLALCGPASVRGGFASKCSYGQSGLKDRTQYFKPLLGRSSSEIFIHHPYFLFVGISDNILPSLEGLQDWHMCSAVVFLMRSVSAHCLETFHTANESARNVLAIYEDDRISLAPRARSLVPPCAYHRCHSS